MRTTMASLCIAVKMNCVVPSEDPYPRERKPILQNRPPPSFPISRRSWVVRTESNVWKERIKKPVPPCEICGGGGKVDCYGCLGRGRTNCLDLAMLPKGEWPNWCKTCGGSGLGYCDRCLGTGEYRGPMGFHFMRKKDGDGEKKERPS